jgi:hypothetical protein
MHAIIRWTALAVPYPPGGPIDMTTLYVTTTPGHLFKAKTDRAGWAMNA